MIICLAVLVPRLAGQLYPVGRSAQGNSLQDIPVPGPSVTAVAVRDSHDQSAYPRRASPRQRGNTPNKISHRTPYAPVFPDRRGAVPGRRGADVPLYPGPLVSVEAP